MLKKASHNSSYLAKVANQQSLNDIVYVPKHDASIQRKRNKRKRKQKERIQMKLGYKSLANESVSETI